MLLQRRLKTPARDARWDRWQKDVNDLHEAIREACENARVFLGEKQGTVTPRRGKPRLPRQAE